MIKEEIKNKEIYFCTKLRILRALTSAGFRPFATMPDKRDHRLTVWLFDRTEEFNTALDGYYAMREAEIAQEVR